MNFLAKFDTEWLHVKYVVESKILGTLKRDLNSP